MRHPDMTQQDYRVSYSRYRKARDIVRHCEYLERRANYYRTRIHDMLTVKRPDMAEHYAGRATSIERVAGAVKRSALARMA